MCEIIQSMKICSRCKELLPLSSFNKSASKISGVCTYCKKCNKAYLKEHYRDNKQYYLNKSKERKAEINDFIWRYKLARQCTKCDEAHPATLVFHHRNPGDKEIDIARLGNGGWSDKRIITEL